MKPETILDILAGRADGDKHLKSAIHASNFVKEQNKVEFDFKSRCNNDWRCDIWFIPEDGFFKMSFQKYLPCPLEPSGKCKKEMAFFDEIRKAEDLNATFEKYTGLTL